MHINHTPQFACPQDYDLYTLKGSSKGNKALTRAIGLISADEVVYAGGGYSLTNSTATKSYLYNGFAFSTMTPLYFSSTARVYGTGLYPFRVENFLVNGFGSNSIRPVINIKPNVKTITGSGTSSNPYKFS